MKKFRDLLTACLMLLVLALPQLGAAPEKKLYVVGYSHLDTEWRWDYTTTIRKFLWNTLVQNFPLFEKYPHYVFNFSGANRYRMMKEYYPDEYEQVKKYAAAGRWFPCGSSVEENDVLAPAPESIIRQVLYGNRFFRQEFGLASREYMLPDCFGFPASLPTLLAHCGLVGFSTQKLTWNSARRIPFNIGLWQGPDGQSVIASFNPGDYVYEAKEDLSQSTAWLKRIDDLGNKSGLFSEYMYHGSLGDVGGAPTESSVRWIEKAQAGNGPLRVISAAADRFFLDITPEQRAKLPLCQGEFLLTNHSAGSITSAAFMKRCNRKNEQLAGAAEAAAVIGDWLGASAYPREKIGEAWRLVLGAQFHDILPGTCVPQAYQYAQNDELLAAEQFAAVLADGVGAAVRALDTRSNGVPLVVYNPLAMEREEAVEAAIDWPGMPPAALRAFAADGREVPCQVTSRQGQRLSLLLLARVPSIGLAVFDIRPAMLPGEMPSEIAAGSRTLENSRYRVSLDEAGDIASIFDKKFLREILSAPARLVFLHERPARWPVWNMDWQDRQKPPIGYVDGPATMRLVESGPVRATWEVRREARGSRFCQRISLSAGAAADRIEIASRILWHTPAVSLKAAFPLAVANANATYDGGLGTVERGNNEEKKFEVPAQQWFDLTDRRGDYGVSILNDCKYGSDKPADGELRLTLLYTPGIRGVYRDQAVADFGEHEMVYALYGHGGDWRAADSGRQAARLNQPLRAFQAESHAGSRGRRFSFLALNDAAVTLMALKKAEASDELIVRLLETKGRPAAKVRLTAAAGIVAAREVDGQEQPLGTADLDRGALVVDFGPYQPRTFALRLKPPATRLAMPAAVSVALPYDLDGISLDADKKDGAFDAQGRTYPGEWLPDRLLCDGIPFVFGPKSGGGKNILSCRGQTITLPSGKYNRLYILAAASTGDGRGKLTLDGKPVDFAVSDWSGFYGQWDTRQWDNYVYREEDYTWADIDFIGVTPAYLRQDQVAVFTTHRHLASGGNDPYAYAYIYKYRIELPVGTKTLTLPDNDKIRIFAMTVAANENDAARPAAPLYDTLQRQASDFARYATCPAARIMPAGGFIAAGKTENVILKVNDADAVIHYTLDGSEPTAASPIYGQPLAIDRTATIRALALKPGVPANPEAIASFYQALPVHSLTQLSPFSSQHPGRGERTLIDFKRAEPSSDDLNWQGYAGADAEILLDLGKAAVVHHVYIGCLSQNQQQVFLPAAIEVAAGLQPGRLTPAGQVRIAPASEDEGPFVRDLAVTVKPVPTRYLRIKIANIGLCPAWNQNAGQKAWMLLDEIIVD